SARARLGMVHGVWAKVSRELKEYVGNTKAQIVGDPFHRGGRAGNLLEFSRRPLVGAVLEQANVHAFESKHRDQAERLLVGQKGKREICTGQLVVHRRSSGRVTSEVSHSAAAR